MIRAEAFRPIEQVFAAGTPRLEPAWNASLVEDESGLDALAQEWTALLASSPADELFLTPEWLATWWRRVGVQPESRSRASLALVVVRRGGRLAAIAPFERSRSRRGALFGATTLRFLGGGQVGSDYLDLVTRGSEEVGALVRIAEALEREGAIVDLRQVPKRRSSSALLAGLLVLHGWRAIEAVTHVCPVIDLAGHDWESFVATLGASHRANVRRRLRKLEARFEVRFRQVEDPRELDEAYATLVELHGRRWATRGGSDGLAGPAMIGFHREFARLALARGWLRLQRLELDGRTVAALYGFRYGDRFLFYQSGFDPQFEEHSVGLACLALSIRSAIEEGATEYDLLHGEESYKRLWTGAARELVRVELFPPSATGRLRFGARRVELAAKRRLESWLAGRSLGDHAGPGRTTHSGVVAGETHAGA